MLSFLMVLIVIAAILLVIIVLAQNPKGGGLAQGFSSSNQIMGVQNTNKFLNKATWSLVAFIAFASIITAGMKINDKSDQDQSQSEIIKQAKKESEKAASANTKTALPFGASSPTSTPAE